MGIIVRLRTLCTGLIKCFCSVHLYQQLSQGKSKMAGRFRSYVWDPMLIISQMIALQCIFYLTLGLITAGFLAMAGYYPSLRYIFDWQSVHFRSRENQIVMVTHILNSLFGAITLWFIIQRAKQCLDFTCTLHLYHLIICWVYTSHFPASLSWWLIQIVCIVLMVVIGEYLCFRSAMKDIPVMGSKTEV
ncbi:protein SYS1 homolog [Styela clava]